MQLCFSLVIISSLNCSAPGLVPVNGTALQMGRSYSSIKLCERASASHHTTVRLPVPGLVSDTVLWHGKQNQVSPHCKAMLISHAIKTFRAINKEKGHERKECQTEVEEGIQTVAHKSEECRRLNTG